MKETGKSMPNPNKQRKRKSSIRDHSFSLVHGDFHIRTEDDPYTTLDDAPRMILSRGEFTEAATDIAISAFREGTDTAAEYCMKRGEYGQKHTVLR